MVGLLTAVKGTDLYSRLQREGRLLDKCQGDNVSFNLNFVPEMDRQTLLQGYKRVLSTLYDPSLEKYFERSLTLLRRLKAPAHARRKIGRAEILALVRSIRRQLFSKQGPAYFRFVLRVLRERPVMFPEAIRLAIMGYHFSRVTSQQIAVHEFRNYLNRELEALRVKLRSARDKKASAIVELQAYVQQLLRSAHERYARIHADFQHHVKDAWEAFQEAALACERELTEYTA
jgi:hypothetical protein